MITAFLPAEQRFLPPPRVPPEPDGGGGPRGEPPSPLFRALLCALWSVGVWGAPAMPDLLGEPWTQVLRNLLAAVPAAYALAVVAELLLTRMGR